MAVRDCLLAPSNVFDVLATGWIVTYVIDVRGGGPSSGYISTGFFGGMHSGTL